MKRTAKGAPVLCTLLLLGLGLYLPRLTSLVTDRQMESRTIQREDGYVSLSLSQTANFFQALELFVFAQTRIELTEGMEPADGYKLSAAEAQSVAAEARGGISGILAAADPEALPDVTPILFASNDSPGLSGVFWCCQWWDDAGAQDLLWLDDKSGQMVAFMGRLRWNTVAADQSVLPEAAVALAEFCRGSYPVEDVWLDFKTKGDYAAVGDAYNDYILTLQKSEEGVDYFQTLPIRQRGNWIYFNL